MAARSRTHSAATSRGSNITTSSPVLVHAVDQHEVLLRYLPWCYPAAGGAQPLLLLSRQASRCHALPALRNEAVVIQGMKTVILFLRTENISQKPSKTYVKQLCAAVWKQCCGVAVLPLFGHALLHVRDAVFLRCVAAAGTCFFAGVLRCCGTAVVALLHHVPPAIPRRTAVHNKTIKKTTQQTNAKTTAIISHNAVTTSFLLNMWSSQENTGQHCTTKRQKK